jgi:hypothetical protein
MAGSNDHDRAMSAAAGTLAIAADPMHGPATYFDGVTSKRHDVIVETAATSLRIINGERADLLDEWSYADLRSRSAPEGILRLGRRGESALARLEVRDAALAAAIAKRAPSLDRGGAADRTLRRRVVVLSLAAIASLVLTAVFGMPVLANRITPLVPLPMESDSARRSTNKFGRRSISATTAPPSSAAMGHPRRRGPGRSTSSCTN